MERGTYIIDENKNLASADGEKRAEWEQKEPERVAKSDEVSDKQVVTFFLGEDKAFSGEDQSLYVVMTFGEMCESLKRCRTKEEALKEHARLLESKNR